MTFIVSYAGPEFALVAADTRGYRLAFDAAARRRARILERRDGVSKIHPLPGGWLVGAGATHQWPRLVPAIASRPAADLGVNKSQPRRGT